MKNINKTAIFYIILIIIFTLFLGFISSNNNKNNINNNSKEEMNKSTKIVTLETNVGNIEIELYADHAPKTVSNFLKLAESDFYNNTKFHRVIKGFMIQGGDPYTKGEDKSVYGTGGPGYKFEDEANDLPMVRGMLAMANSGPNTNGSQFFIITAIETPWLVGKHTVFGKVISGMDIVDRIENSQTDQNDLPIIPIIINTINVNNF